MITQAGPWELEQKEAAQTLTKHFVSNLQDVILMIFLVLYYKRAGASVKSLKFSTSLLLRCGCFNGFH